MQLDSLQILLILAVPPSCFGLLLYAAFRSARRTGIRDRAERAVEEAKLQAELQAELCNPRTSITIETYNECLTTSSYPAMIAKGLGHRYLMTSAEVANKAMMLSWKRGYFKTDKGLHIPIRNVKAAYFDQESK